MKVFVITILCAFAGCVAGGAIAWPGALAVSSPLLKTIIPGETKTSAYSTTQYINAVPTSYSIAAHPQFAFNIPQVNTFASLQHPYYTVAGPSYIPAANIFYPSAPAYSPILGAGFPSAPIAPTYPIAPPNSPSPVTPAYPEGTPSESITPAPGDGDSAVIDSADFKPEQQMRQDSEASSPSFTPPPSQQPSQPAAPQFPPSNTFPNFPTIPQIPQETGQTPSFPQLPQLPQIPGFPQFPPNVFPQDPSQSAPPSNYPASINEDRGLSDEDTVSVESA